MSEYSKKVQEKSQKIGELFIKGNKPLNENKYPCLLNSTRQHK